MNKTKDPPQNCKLVCRLAENSRIKLVGLGGIGCIVMQHLALFLKNLCRPVRLVLIDGDDFEPDNAQRMHFHTLGNKAEVKAAETIAALGPSDIAIVPVPEYVTPENIGRLIRSGDHVLLCVDNYITRRIVSEHCQTLDDVALFSGGNDGVNPPHQRGTYGNIQIAIRREGQDLTAPITRYHPEIARAKGELPGGKNCGQLAKSVPQIQFANLTAATWMLNALFAYMCGRLAYQEVQFDILEARSLPQFLLKEDEIPQPPPASD